MLVTTLSAQIVLAVFALVYAASVLAAVVAVRDPQAPAGLKAAWVAALLLLPPVGLLAWEAARVADHRAAHRVVTVRDRTAYPADRAAHVAGGSARV
ncbi:PLDc N-terminal domain-containing protein [Microbacterium sp. PRF11]|uniref:PLDc N-terminal domain-containing protein n=1 Tax=Microbacterium sp. PRF11 TaxID=2962593 RepID=UPI00288156FF|nr:PLDc N-terminal domain-containing protein [Microbacterium sp. PRF11]MDT0117048.1 PLDc N-terminal domain-containing protein [Microbacterium sp. PRF11]